MCLKQKFTYYVFVNISVKRVFAIGWYFNWKKGFRKKKKNAKIPLYCVFFQRFLSISPWVSNILTNSFEILKKIRLVLLKEGHLKLRIILFKFIFTRVIINWWPSGNLTCNFNTEIRYMKYTDLSHSIQMLCDIQIHH